MIAGTDIDDLDAQLAAAYRADREVADMGKPSVRRAREKQHALSPDDGRRKRKTGRTAQFNVKMKPDLKRQVVQASRDRGISSFSRLRTKKDSPWMTNPTARMSSSCVPSRKNSIAW
jgi:hypothetical protein